MNKGKETLKIKLPDYKLIKDDKLEKDFIELALTFSFIGKIYILSNKSYYNNSKYKEFNDIINKMNEGVVDFFELLSDVCEYNYIFSKYPELKGFAVANYLVKTRNYGSRTGNNVKNGTKEQQFNGIYSEIVISQLIDEALGLGSDYSLKESVKQFGNDGGVDYNLGGLRVDIKTSVRNCYIKPNYSHNFVKSQTEKQNTDAYIAASLNLKEGVLEISGIIMKDDMIERSTLRKSGSTMSNNTKEINVIQDMYDLHDSQITTRFSTVNQILEYCLSIGLFTNLELKDEVKLNSSTIYL